MRWLLASAGAALIVLLATLGCAQPPPGFADSFGSSQAERNLRREYDQDGDRVGINLKGRSTTPTPAAADRCVLECNAATDTLEMSVSGGSFAPIGTGAGVCATCVEGTAGVGTNIAGGNVTVRGGAGTGSGFGGSVFISKCPNGGGGSTPNTCSTAWQFEGNVGALLPAAGASLGTSLAPLGTLWVADVRNTGIAVEVPGTAQAFTAPSNTFIVNMTYEIFTTTGAITLLSTPTIANGSVGQRVKIRNVDTTATDCLTFQDQDTLAATNLQLGAPTRTVCPNDVLQLTYDGTVGDWVEDFYLGNNIAGRGGSGTNAVGGQLTIQGGAGTGAGTGGPIALYTCPDGAPGTVTNACLLRWFIDGDTGDLIPNAAFSPDLGSASSAVDFAYVDRLTVNKSLVLTVDSQSITAAGNTIVPTTPYFVLGTVAGNTTLTSTPTIADGLPGQTVKLRNVDGTATDCVTIQSNPTTFNLILGAASRQLCPGDTIQLSFDNGLGAWVEDFFTNVP